MRFLPCLVILFLLIDMGLSVGCSSGEASIMKGMERGTGESKDSFIPLKGGGKKPEGKTDPAPRRVPE
jgi:hypothetical protein